MAPDVFRLRRRPPVDACGHCHAVVPRVWLVPGDVLDSCAACYERATGRLPVHEQGHSSAPASPPPTVRATAFHVRADGRRPA